MKNKNLLIAFATCFVIYVTLISNSTFAQSEPWDESLISAHTVMSVNINVARLHDHLEGNTEQKKLVTFLEQKKGIKLSEVEQFQYFISTPPELPIGADDNSNMQLTFREKQKFDAESVGKMTGYSLTAESIGDQDKYSAFMGKPNKAGTWGGVIANDRTVVFAVRRKMETIFQSQGLKRRPEHLLSKISRGNRDVFVTISGGDKIKAVFEETWRTDKYSEVFDLYENAWIDFDMQSDTALSAVFKASDEETAIKLEAKLRDLASKGATTLTQIQHMLSQHITEQHKEDLENAIAILDTLEISSEGDTVKISSDEPVAQQLVPTLIRRVLGS